MKLISAVLISFICSFSVNGQDATITIKGNEMGARVSKNLHGIFFEEISHGGEGGLYPELIQNRGFEESRVPEGCTVDSGFVIPPATPHFGTHRVVDWKMPWEPKNQHPAWSLITNGKSIATISIDHSVPLNKATPASLKVAITKASPANVVDVVNEGFWGINVVKGESYPLYFYARCQQYKGTVTAKLVGADGKILATKKITIAATPHWEKLSGSLVATASGQKATFQLSFDSPGVVWLDFVSLFPPTTFMARPNGMRVDLANYLVDLKPAFVRWPGGCFVEGISQESAPNWKRTLGPLEERSGTYSPWGYWSNDGIGYHEFLQFCEDLQADAMYVFNCGISCEMRSGVYRGDEDVPRIVADVLDAIEYAIGPVDSKWGLLRAKNGHPEPFPLKYVEVGNEQIGEEYAKRFNIFYTAIKEKFPQLEILAAMGIAHLDNRTIKAIEKMDVADEHAYKAEGWAMIYHDWYDKYKREDWKLYVGEYACNSGVGNGNMMAALNDATFILGMERNADLITMSSYAPLLENVNDTDWPVNLIRFDHAKSFARISYYAIQMLNENKATVNLKTIVERTADKTLGPSYSGGIALSTWDTQAEFKDIQVIKDEKIIYQMGEHPSDSEWTFDGGQWAFGNKMITQSAEGAWPMAMLKLKDLDTYTLKLKAKKTGGYNAFMIPFAITDQNNYLRAHIGAWVNRIAAFEKVTKGQDAIVTQPVRLENPIELNRWYDIELNVGNDVVECYLDGELLMTYRHPDKLFSIAGMDEAKDELVIKIVNGYGKQQGVNIKLKDIAKVDSTATVITLNSGSGDDENSFAEPEKFVPLKSTFSGVDLDFMYEVKPFSVTILRIKKQSP